MAAGRKAQKLEALALEKAGVKWNKDGTCDEVDFFVCFFSSCSELGDSLGGCEGFPNENMNMCGF